MLRLFVGIRLPASHVLALGRLCSGLPGARWVEAANYHVTLRFIGEVDEGIAADIDLGLGRVAVPRFSMAVAGIGVFDEGGRPHTLYAGVERADRLLALRDRVEHAMMRIGLAPERRRFLPHVTLARLHRPPPEPLRRYIEANGAFRLPPFEVDRFELVASYLTKSGSIYEDVASYALP